MPLDNQLLLKVILIRKLRKKLNRKPRAMSIRPIFLNRIIQGESTLIQELRSDPQYHSRYFRMTKDNFDLVLSVIGPYISGKRTHSRPISPVEKLAVTLRYLASGNSQVSLAFNFRISPSSISCILREVIRAIIKHFGPLYLPPASEDSWIKNEQGFRIRWNHPNAIGALDGKHVRIQAPTLSGSTHHNYKGFVSIVLMAIAGPDYSFTMIDVGSSGSQSDGGVFSRSKMGQHLQNGLLNIPPPKSVGQYILPHVLVADDAFALKPNLMKPYPGKFLSVERRIYNYRMSRARMVVENTFGVLAARWRIFHAAIAAELEFVKEIVYCTAILHNFLIKKNDLNGITTDTTDSVIGSSGNWRETVQNDTGIVNLCRQGSSNHSVRASDVRDKFKDYFNGEGAVNWQNSRI